MNASHVRPHNVNTALMLLWIALGIGALLGLLRVMTLQSSNPYTPIVMMMLIGVVVLLFSIGLDVLLIVLIGKRMNWARIVYLVLLLLGIPFFIYGLATDTSRGPLAWVLMAMWLPLILRAVAMWLVFGPVESRDWFARRETTAVSVNVPARSQQDGQAMQRLRIRSSATASSALEAFASGREEARADPVVATAAKSVSDSALPASGATVPAVAASSKQVNRHHLCRRFEAASSNVRLWLVLFWADFALGLITVLLFVNKLRQTSEFALRYSRVTQEQVGHWTIALALMVLIGVVFLIMTLVTRSNRAAARSSYVAKLRSDLEAARRDGNLAVQVECESELRRLGR